VKPGELLGVGAGITVAMLTLAAPSHADDGESDQTFRRLLDHEGLLFNYPIEKYQGQRYCEAVIDGDQPIDATNDLARDGAYSFDIANGISSAAMVAYCTCADSAREGIPADPILCKPFELEYQREH
jgi:hypothetical protein